MLMIRQTTPAFLAFSLLAIATAPVGLWADVIQSSEGRGLALIETAGGYQIADFEGNLTPIETPPGVFMRSFHELSDGWVAVGDGPQDNSRDLVVLRSSPGGVERLESPAGRDGQSRIQAVPLVASGKLVGLAWLEGDGGEKNAVMASRWSGSYWVAGDEVASSEPDAQLALTGAVLEDGTTVLAWAAVRDGDDDVLWSRFSAGRWSQPALVHEENDVPDVVPQLVAVSGGAIVAWSWFDGADYRLRVSRFDGATWSDTGFRGEKGSMAARFRRTDAGATLLYSSVAPSQWALVEFEGDGRVARSASYERGAEPRPMVVPVEEGEVGLRWPTLFPIKISASVEDPGPTRLRWIDR